MSESSSSGSIWAHLWLVSLSLSLSLIRVHPCNPWLAFESLSVPLRLCEREEGVSRRRRVRGEIVHHFPTLARAARSSERTM